MQIEIAVAVGAVLVVVAAAAAASKATRLWAGVAIASMALKDAPEPHWSKIRETLAETRMASPWALRIACKRHPPVAG